MTLDAPLPDPRLVIHLGLAVYDHRTYMPQNRPSRYRSVVSGTTPQAIARSCAINRYRGPGRKSTPPAAPQNYPFPGSVSRRAFARILAQRLDTDR